MSDLYIIAGLGNPGPEYQCTRHNVGFMVVDRLCGRWAIPLRAEEKFRAEIGRGEIFGNEVMLLKPWTYMNQSGIAIRAAVDYFKVPYERFIVVLDDVDLPLGRVRMRPEGNSGGHRGLESVIVHLGTNKFPRLRIGIGRDSAGRGTADYVLSRFTWAEWEIMDRILWMACDQLECWLRKGIEVAMNEYNGLTITAEKEGKTP